jgi:integrase
LKWSAIDLERNLIKVEHPKNGKVRFIPINSVLRLEIEQLRAAKCDRWLVFPYRNVRTGFEKACRRAGIVGLTFHDLRRTFGTRLLEAGVNIVTISKPYGHSSVLVTQRYLHPKDGLSVAAVKHLAKYHSGTVDGPEELAQIWHNGEMN